MKILLILLILFVSNNVLFAQTDNRLTSTSSQLEVVIGNNLSASSATELDFTLDMLNVAFCGDAINIKADATQQQALQALNNRLAILCQNAGINIYLLYSPPSLTTSNGQTFTDNLRTQNSAIDLLVCLVLKKVYS